MTEQPHAVLSRPMMHASTVNGFKMPSTMLTFNKQSTFVSVPFFFFLFLEIVIILNSKMKIKTFIYQKHEDLK